MIIRLAVLGTSHVGTIYFAWEKIKHDYPQFEITFFAAPRKNYLRLQIGQDKTFGILDPSLFTPDEIAMMTQTYGATNIALAGFDAVLIVGHETLESKLAGLIAAFSIDGKRPVPDQPRISQAAYDALADDLARGTTLPEEWHHWDKPLVFALPAPRVSERCRKEDAQDTIYGAWSRLANSTADASAKTLFEEHMDRIRVNFDAAGIQLLTPQQDVLAQNGLTHEKFCGGAVRLQSLEAYPETMMRKERCVQAWKV